MKKFLLEIFTWWRGPGIGTRLFTWRKGRYVGQDKQGNRYYEERDGTRRWVIYHGIVEASRVPPGWNGWLHGTFAKPPKEEDMVKAPWQKEHVSNMTGTKWAYAPPGSLRQGGKRQKVDSDYEAWQPEE